MVLLLNRPLASSMSTLCSVAETAEMQNRGSSCDSQEAMSACPNAFLEGVNYLLSMRLSARKRPETVLAGARLLRMRPKISTVLPQPCEIEHSGDTCTDADVAGNEPLDHHHTVLSKQFGAWYTLLSSQNNCQGLGWHGSSIAILAGHHAIPTAGAEMCYSPSPLPGSRSKARNPPSRQPSCARGCTRTRPRWASGSSACNPGVPSGQQVLSNINQQHACGTQYISVQP